MLRGSGENTDLFPDYRRETQGGHKELYSIVSQRIGFADPLKLTSISIPPSLSLCADMGKHIGTKHTHAHIYVYTYMHVLYIYIYILYTPYSVKQNPLRRIFDHNSGSR